MNTQDFPNLWASLGKARSDRVRNHIATTQAVGGPRTRWVNNPHQMFLQELRHYAQNAALDDILTGIVAANGDSDKTCMSAERLFILLSCNKRISTDTIMVTMALEERQARRYMAAAKLAIFLINRASLGDDWEIETLIDNQWLIEDEITNHPHNFSGLVRREPTLAELRART